MGSCSSSAEMKLLRNILLSPTAMAIKLIILSSIARTVVSSCYSNCNNNGNCNKFSQCVCNKGYKGSYCELRVCPYGRAFSDHASADDEGHGMEECSGRGNCNRETGVCECMQGFTGKDCGRTRCNGNCNGRGRCVSIKDKAASTRNVMSERFLYDQVWDAEKIYGCVCDEGFSGYDCSLFDCPTGDDPLTTGQVDEVQLLKCTSDPSLDGTFALYFKGFVSKTVKASATLDEVREAIESIRNVGKVKVEFSDGAVSVCQTAETNVVRVTFLENFGALPPIVPYESDLLPIGSTIEIGGDGTTTFTDYLGTIHASVKGTKEDLPCAGRGKCDTTTGVCECYADNGDSFGSSNSKNEAGTRGDCGFAMTSTTNCPGETSCSLHGICAETTYKCSCEEGWYGGNCGLRECLKGPSWFSYPSADNVGHDVLTECSDMGICDSSVGVCECAPGFFGEACQYMACGGGTGNPCSGHGRCLSMRHLSWETTNNGEATDFEYGTDPNVLATWDADRIFGCSCDDGWEGYDCSMRKVSSLSSSPSSLCCCCCCCCWMNE